MRVSFWKKEESGNMLSHGKGLTEEEVTFLKSLNVGDRLIIWDNQNTKKSEVSPGFSMSKFNPSPRTDAPFI